MATAEICESCEAGLHWECDGHSWNDAADNWVACECQHPDHDDSDLDTGDRLRAMLQSSAAWRERTGAGR